MGLIVGMTEATDAPFGVSLLQMSQEMPEAETHPVLSEWAKTAIEPETPHSIRGVSTLAGYCHSPTDRMVAISSGSFHTDGMVTTPYSMKTLAGIRTGCAGGLADRTADVVLKEGRKLVLVPREMPFSTTHLENMLTLSRIGVAMVPLMPVYYNHPQTVDDITQHIVMRMFDQFGLKHPNARRRQSLRQAQDFPQENE